MKRTALFGAAVALLVGIWFVASWRPESARLAEARADRVAAEAEVDELLARFTGLRSAAARASQLELDAGQLRAAVPDDPQLALLLLQANDAAGRAGVQYLTVTPSPPTAPSTPGAAAEMKVSFDVTGTYAQLLDFLDRLAALPRALVVDSVNVTPEGQGPSPNLRVAIAGRVFTSAQPAPDPSVPG